MQLDAEATLKFVLLAPPKADLVDLPADRPMPSNGYNLLSTVEAQERVVPESSLMGILLYPKRYVMACLAEMISPQK